MTDTSRDATRHKELIERLEFIANEPSVVSPEEIEEVCDLAADALRLVSASEGSMVNCIAIDPSAIRESIIEECARVAENTPTVLEPSGTFFSERCATAIRALKNAAPQEVERQAVDTRASVPAVAAPSGDKPQGEASEIEEALWALHAYEAIRDDELRRYSEADITRMVQSVRSLPSATLPPVESVDCSFRWLGSRCIPRVTVEFGHEDWKARDTFAAMLPLASASTGREKA